MAGIVADAVFDVALQHIEDTVDLVQVLAAGSSVLVAHSSSGSDITFTGPVNGATGRKTAFDGLSSIAASASGSATKVTLVIASSGSSPAVLITADITSAPVSIQSTDKVNIGGFDINLQDPT